MGLRVPFKLVDKMKVYGNDLSEEDQAYKEKWLSRLQKLDSSFTPSRRVNKLQELIWGFIDQVKRGKKLSKKQVEIVSSCEYKIDTKGDRWEID